MVFSFSAKIVRLQGSYWIHVPAKVSEKLASPKKVPVLAQVDGGEPFHGTLMPAGEGRHRLMVNDRVRGGAQSGELHVTFRLADPKRAVEIPEDVAAALDEAGVREAWESMPPGKREHILGYIEQAAREETRSKRIAQTVEIAEGKRERRVDRRAARK
jgi:hypothetical protein